MKKKHDLKNSTNWFFTRFVLRAKLTCLILLMLGWHLTANAGFQNPQLNLSLKGKTIKEALHEIEEKSEFRFIYENEKIDLNKKINIDVSEGSVEDILKQIFSNESIDFSITKNNLILIKPTPKPQDQKTNKTIKGKVSDTTGAPLPGVTVIIKGSTNGTVTDYDGNYVLSDVPSGAILVFSFIGMDTQEKTVGNILVIDVVLQSNTIGLEEVVAIGYGVQKKATLSGSVTNLEGEKLAESPVTNVSQGIAGRLPGVVATSNGGEPGYDGTTLRIRGVNTFGNAAPLIVVDGVPGRSLDRIDPSTIESVAVMKDASAAIYGAQAANGVILITTKRGTIGKPSVKFSYNYGMARPTKLPELTNAAEYATLLNEIDEYNGANPRYTNEEIQKFSDGSDPWGYPDTDWFGETLKPWSDQTYGNVSIDGGSEFVKYFVSISEKSQDGFYKNSASRYNQYDFKSNLDVKINKYLKLFINTTGRFEDRNFPVRSAENIFRMIMRSKPTMPAYWPNGLPGPDIEFGDNPVVISTKQTGYQRDKRYIFNGDFGVDFSVPGIEGLTVKATASLDKTFRFNKVWQKPWYLYTWDRESYDENGIPLLVKGQKGFTDPRLSESMEDNQSILLNGILNYKKSIGDHSINLMAGAEKITGKGDSFSAYRRYFLSDAIDQLFAGGQEEINNDGSGYEEARLNYFGRVNYSFQNKYLAEFVWRYQGSYIFEESSRFGFFPGVSLGYVISEENFWKQKIPFINYAKIRASWGETGNDLISAYQYLATYTLNGLNYYTNGGATANQGLYETRIPNTGVTWESAVQKNIGIDMQFLDGKFALTADYFVNTRDDILWSREATLPSTSGVTMPAENIGKCENKGLDFSLDYHKRSGELKFGAGINGVFSKNKILYWAKSPGAPKYQQSTGRPIGASLYYNAIGVFKDQAAVDAYPHWDGARPGDIIFEDYNKDGVIDANDRVMHDISSAPTFTGGLNFDVQYKGFDLSVLFQGATGGVFYYDSESGDFANYFKSFYDKRWTKENPNSKHPRTFNRTAEYWKSNSNTYWLHKTDYVRLKNIELGYTIPKSITQKYLIQNFRMYISAFNLLTYSPDMKDFDPENTSSRGYNYPLNKVINFGFNITF